MQTVQRSLALALLSSALLAAAAPGQAQTTVAAADTAASAAACARAGQLSNLQRRIVEKASEGTPALIRYVHGTRMIHRLDLVETAAWVDARGALLRSCGVAVAGPIASAAQPTN